MVQGALHPRHRPLVFCHWTVRLCATLAHGAAGGCIARRRCAVPRKLLQHCSLFLRQDTYPGEVCPGGAVWRRALVAQRVEVKG